MAVQQTGIMKMIEEGRMRFAAYANDTYYFAFIWSNHQFRIPATKQQLGERKFGFNEPARTFKDIILLEFEDKAGDKLPMDKLDIDFTDKERVNDLEQRNIELQERVKLLEKEIIHLKSN